MTRARNRHGTACDAIESHDEGARLRSIESPSSGATKTLPGGGGDPFGEPPRAMNGRTCASACVCAMCVRACVLTVRGGVVVVAVKAGWKSTHAPPRARVVTKCENHTRSADSRSTAVLTPSRVRFVVGAFRFRFFFSFFLSSSDRSIFYRSRCASVARKPTTAVSACLRRASVVFGFLFFFPPVVLGIFSILFAIVIVVVVVVLNVFPV